MTPSLQTVVFSAQHEITGQRTSEEEEEEEGEEEEEEWKAVVFNNITSNIGGGEI